MPILLTLPGKSAFSSPKPPPIPAAAIPPPPALPPEPAPMPDPEDPLLKARKRRGAAAATSGRAATVFSGDHYSDTHLGGSRTPGNL